MSDHLHQVRPHRHQQHQIENNLIHKTIEDDDKLTYKVLSGAVNQGENYEIIFIANVALELALNDDIKEFLISANNTAFYPFDDVTIETETVDGGQEKLALQLKHGERLLTIQSMTTKSGDFSIQKYVDGIRKLKKVSSESQPLQLDNFKWILFTNRKCNYENGVKLKLENENVHIKMLPCESENSLKICSKNSSSSYKFEVCEDVSTEITQFFENFFLYVDQLNVDQMEEELSERFQNEFSCDKTVFMQYLNFITKWSNTKGKRKKLNKWWIKQLIAMHLLSPLIQPFSKSSIEDKKFNILRKCIDSFDVTIFGKGDIKNISQFWDPKRELENVDTKNVNELKNKFQINPNDPTNVESSKLLWLLGKCPLIIKYADNITKAIRLCENMKFVIINGDSLIRKREDYLKNMSVFQNLSHLKTNISYYEELVKTFRCSLQGKVQITLETLINGCEDFQRCITTDDLLLFLNDNLEIGKEQDDLKIYVSRLFSRQVIEAKFLEEFNEDCVILIDCFEMNGMSTNLFEIKYTKMWLDSNTKVFFGETKNRKKIIYLTDKRINLKQLKALSENIKDKDKEPKRLHQLRWFNGKLEWISSLGQITDLKNFLNNEEYFMKEEELYNNESDDRNIIIFCGDAGLGKTTLMQNLRKNIFPSLWTVLLHPKDHSKHLKETNGDIKKFENYVLDEAGNKYSDFDLKIFQTLLKTGRINYIWDGLDEISEESLYIVLDIIEALFKKGLKQFLTSRNNLRECLENRFHVFAKTIKEFDEMEQKCYIRSRLNCEDDELEELFQKIGKHIYLFKHKEILSIPLQIYMFTELLLQNQEKYNSLLDNMFLLTDLYEYFIEEKFNIYCKQKEKVNYSSDFLMNRIKDYKEKRMYQYQLAALKLYFPDQVFESGEDVNHFFTEIKVKDVIGIITSVSSENVVNFLHNSYGEYFAALYFSRNYRNIQNLRFLFEEKNKNIRFMLDLILAKDCPAHVATLCHNLQLLKSYEKDVLIKIDQGGRSALHLLCSWGKSYPSLLVDECVQMNKKWFKWFKNKPIYRVYPGNLLQREDLEYEDILKYLIQHCDSELEDQVYKLKAISYADESCNLSAFSALLKNYVGSVKNFKCFKNIPSLLCYSAAFDFSSIFDFIKKIPYITITYRPFYNDDSLLTLAAINGSLSSCHKILSKSSRHHFNINDSFAKTCKEGHVNTADLLIGTGADVDFIDIYGETALTVACKNGKFDVVSFLIKAHANVNRADTFGTLPLTAACENGFVDIVDLLVKAGANPSNGRNPLILACQEGRIDVANYLIKAGVDINETDESGASPLIVACERGHACLVSLLIKAGADIDMFDRYGSTALLAACNWEHVDVVDLLIKAGADVNMVNEIGVTPLILACKKRLVDVVFSLIEAGADINLIDNYDRTPLAAACEAGLIDIANTLIEAGVDINVVDEVGVTPLILACKKELVDVVNSLIEAGAEINVADDYGGTPLTIVCHNGLIDAVNLLIKAGADINIVDEMGVTPLIIACSKRFVDVADSLIKAGADVNLKDKYGRNPLTVVCQEGLLNIAKSLIKADADINFVDKYGTNPLLAACDWGHADVTDLLIKARADVNVVNEIGTSPLILACKEKLADVAISLIKAGADINLIDNYGRSPLTVACQEQLVDVANFLISAGANVNIFNKFAPVPLTLACMNRLVDVANSLIKAGAHINYTDDNGKTPLTMVCEKGLVEVVNTLIKEGAYIDKDDRYGKTPLIAACAKGHIAVANILIKAGADINRADTRNRTPLITACNWEEPDVATLLIKAGADINLVDNCDRTPLMVACEEGLSDVVNLLIKESADLNRPNINNTTPLIKACTWGHLDIANLLIEAGADINLSDNFGTTALSAACQEGFVDIANLLVAAGADVNSRYESLIRNLLPLGRY